MRKLVFNVALSAATFAPRVPARTPMPLLRTALFFNAARQSLLMEAF